MGLANQTVGGTVAMTSAGNGPVGRGPLREPGDNPVDAPITCVLTRFQLRSARHLVPSYRDYQRVIRELEQSRVPGFLRAAFLVENPTTWYSLSLWAGDSAIPRFGTVSTDHLAAARRPSGGSPTTTRGRCCGPRSGG